MKAALSAAQLSAATAVYDAFRLRFFGSLAAGAVKSKAGEAG
jgi:hypothetical protein